MLFLILFYTPAIGQDSQEFSVKNGDIASAKIEAVTVTAQKKEENVQQVPMSLSVFSDQMIEESGINNNIELMRLAPNVYVRDAGSNYQTIIRGVTGFENALHSVVGYYINDINIPLVYMQNPDLLDVERVEVLKGPQGALYGRNSESGVINIVTRQPDNEQRGKVFCEYNSYDTEHGSAPGYQVGGNFSTPLVKDTLYIGVAGKYNYTDGFMKNKYDNDDKADEGEQFNGHMNLRWTPTQAWDVALIFDALDSDDGFSPFRNPQTTGRHVVNYNDEHDREQNGNTQALRIKYQGDIIDVLSVTGRNDFDDKVLADYDMTPMSILPSVQKEEDTHYSQEFRISSSANSQHLYSWLVGTYFFKEDIGTFFNMGTAKTTDIDIEGAALFGQATYTLFGKLHLTGGARYDYQKMDGTQNCNNAEYDGDSSKGEFLPKLSIAYDLTDAAMVYATVSKGYMSGGYNFTTATSKDTFMYGPEYTWNYELGLKSSWLDNRLITNLSAFYIDMKDKQVSEVDAVTLSANTSNAAKARSMGVELEVQARPARGWNIYGGIGYSNTKIKDWVATEFNSVYNGTVQYDYSGKELPNAPCYTYNLGTQYVHETGFYGRVDLLGTGDFYHDSKNTVHEESYELVNLRLGYMMNDFEIAFWCKNLFDKDYYTVHFAWGGMEGGFDSEPRQVGTTLTYRF
jgi:iron complex outermembrane receptor protein